MPMGPLSMIHWVAHNHAGTAEKAMSTQSMIAAVIIHKQVQEALSCIAEKVLVVYGGAAKNHRYIRYGSA